MTVRRVLAFIDRPGDRFEEAAAFWTTATGTRLSPRQGDDGGGAHLDLEVDDVRASLTRAVALGAAVAADHGDWAVLRSPEGRAFCLVPGEGTTRRPPVFARLDQVCLALAGHARPGGRRLLPHAPGPRDRLTAG
ncbi:hypothetical protein SAMN05421833_10528 [Microbispora rosea]|uniref:Glyoxalase-like domain-containing protein n=1 Tax=Microbispora rosea TaxID=58117 RepID=A0A1N6X5U4_9ACTN|nr:VOC family protein [Microbispora rosea]GIH52841.1 hypothetical protein Mro03_80200 [Microbispora rosea subsp. rosea]SIQ97734.1 hypothetical protein SAMN05421833_10528 [Microbispora rosea]